MGRIKKTSKKVKLGKQGRRRKWAPFWAVIKKFGEGKRKHPSEMTRVRRNWRRNKLKIKPRKEKKKHLG
jgi:ribosomal protein L39E